MAFTEIASHLGSNIIPSATDLSVGIQMFSDPVARTLSLQVGYDSSDAIKDSYFTAQRIKENEDDIDSRLGIEESDAKKLLQSIGSTVVFASLGAYTAFSDTIMAPGYRIWDEMTKNDSLLIEAISRIGGFLGISGTAALGFSMFLRRRLRRRDEKIEAKKQELLSQGFNITEQIEENDAEFSVCKDLDQVKDKVHKEAGYLATLGEGVPLRVQLRELDTNRELVLHSLYYVLIGELALFEVANTIGATNGIYFGTIGLAIANSLTSGRYKGELVSLETDQDNVDLPHIDEDTNLKLNPITPNLEILLNSSNVGSK